MIERLNQSFGLEKFVWFESGQSGFPKAILSHPNGSRAEIYIHGAQVTSWQTPNQGEILFLSSSAEFARSRPIRGGIPVVFPQFGPGELPPHGFARNQAWEVIQATVKESGECLIRFKLSDSGATRNIWPYSFLVELTVQIGGSQSEPCLSVALKVHNPGTIPFAFTAALHTYFGTKDVRGVRIQGLKDLTYSDILNNRAFNVESRDLTYFGGPTDRIYMNVPNKIELHDPAAKRSLELVTTGFRDAVLWNPWDERCRTMADLSPEDYLHFYCLEAAQVNQKITLAPLSKYDCNMLIKAKSQA